MTILSGNRTVNEFAGATRARETMQRRLEEKIANNRALADMHKLPDGPNVTATQETQPQHQRPRINLPG